MFICNGFRKSTDVYCSYDDNQQKPQTLKVMSESSPPVTNIQVVLNVIGITVNGKYLSKRGYGHEWKQYGIITIPNK
jgi:hypothetical protein